MAAPSLKPPRQKRSRKTLARIEEAGRALLRERGPDGLTVQDVVARAHTSVGSFYQRFSGKEELLRHLEEAIAQDAGVRFEDALAERVEPDFALAAKIEAVVALMYEERAAASDLETFTELERTRADLVAGALIGNGNEIRHTDPETAIRIGYAAVSGALREPPTGIAASGLLIELGRLWLTYLGGGPDGGPGKGAVDFFEVWG